MLLLTILKKTAILIILSLVCLSAFGQDYLNPSYRQGFAAEVEAGYICKGAYTNFSLGYNIIHGLYAGLGSGVEYFYFEAKWKKSVFVPTFVQVRYSFLNKKISPFIDFKAGVVGDFTSRGTGHFFRPAIGMEYRRVGLKVGYYWSNMTYENDTTGDDLCTIGLIYRF